MKRAYYDNSIQAFLGHNESRVLGELTRHHSHALEHSQKNAWLAQVRHLKANLSDWGDGYLCLEYAIPRMGKRADVVLLAGGVIFVFEYKVGADGYSTNAIEQVLDYALGLKNFHGGSHNLRIVPVLVATKAPHEQLHQSWYRDRVAKPCLANCETLKNILSRLTKEPRPTINAQQ